MKFFCYIFGCDLIDISDDEILSRMRKYHIFLDPKSEVNLESTLILMTLREIVSDYNLNGLTMLGVPLKIYYSDSKDEEIILLINVSY